MTGETARILPECPPWQAKIFIKPQEDVVQAVQGEGGRNSFCSFGTRFCAQSLLRKKLCKNIAMWLIYN